MPSFDVVSEVDKHEVTNAVDQANREISTRYDFKGVDATFQQNELVVTMSADSDNQLDQMRDMLIAKLVKRGIDTNCLEVGKLEKTGMKAKRDVTLKAGIDTPTAKKIVKMIKDKKLKVQAAIQGEQVRVTGKKRDDLQGVIAFLKGEDVGLPLQFNNFRD
ncbi:UPF0234 protein YajQ [gamma proteobacterium IMCC2047]|nr:UPF0234 protein YajQ [gamma proteobacterium IMCC2047]